jgi:hypothetical protein
MVNARTRNIRSFSHPSGPAQAGAQTISRSCQSGTRIRRVPSPQHHARSAQPQLHHSQRPHRAQARPQYGGASRPSPVPPQRRPNSVRIAARDTQTGPSRAALLLQTPTRIVQAWTMHNAGLRMVWESSTWEVLRLMRALRDIALPGDSRCPDRCVARIAWRCWICPAGIARGRCRGCRRCSIARRGRGRRVRTGRRGMPRRICGRGRAESSRSVCRIFVPSARKATYACDDA